MALCSEMQENGLDMFASRTFKYLICHVLQVDNRTTNCGPCYRITPTSALCFFDFSFSVVSYINRSKHSEAPSRHSYNAKARAAAPTTAAKFPRFFCASLLVPPAAAVDDEVEEDPVADPVAAPAAVPAAVLEPDMEPDTVLLELVPSPIARVALATIGSVEFP